MHCLPSCLCLNRSGPVAPFAFASSSSLDLVTLLFKPVYFFLLCARESHAFISKKYIPPRLQRLHPRPPLLPRQTANREARRCLPRLAWQSLQPPRRSPRPYHTRYSQQPSSPPVTIVASRTPPRPLARPPPCMILSPSYFLHRTCYPFRINVCFSLPGLTIYPPGLSFSTPDRD